MVECLKVQQGLRMCNDLHEWDQEPVNGPCEYDDNFRFKKKVEKISSSTEKC
jgi:hypothetical protein